MPLVPGTQLLENYAQVLAHGVGNAARPRRSAG